MTAIARLLSLVPNRPGAARPFSTRPAGVDDFFLREAFSPGSDDSFINAAVKGAIGREADLAHAGIHVSTSRGTVQLSGFVASRQVMARAVAVARAVRGVRTVRNDMRRA
jgi:osmotically-inducible protein OsmY